MQHLERTHDLSAEGSASSPAARVIDVEDMPVGGEHKRMGSSAEGLKSSVMGAVESADKNALMMKLKELEDEKAKAMGRFDGDIDALRRVLSIM